MTAPDALRDWRKKAGLTQAQACVKVKVTGPTWCHWENGIKEPKLDRAEDLEKLTDGAVTMAMWAEWGRRKRASKARQSKKRVH
jgi:transcriptional regulator with XRE-family HTH domain